VLGNAICDVGGAREVSRTGESKGGGCWWPCVETVDKVGKGVEAGSGARLRRERAGRGEVWYGGWHLAHAAERARASSAERRQQATDGMARDVWQKNVARDATGETKERLTGGSGVFKILYKFQI
jgi:hypothetical protein